MCSVRKHRQSDVIGVFAPLLSLTSGRGVVGYKTGNNPKGHEIINTYDCNLPDRCFLGGLTFL